MALTRRKPRHLEDAAQAHLFTWLRLARFGGLSVATRAWHTPNGGKRSVVTAERLRAMGVKPGVPDVFVAIPRAPWHGLFVELKAGRNRPTDQQAQVLEQLAADGYAVVVAYGWIAAANAIAEYLGIPGPGPSTTWKN